jgi:hypothetical protein
LAGQSLLTVRKLAIELLEFYGPFSPVRRPCDSSPLGFDVFRVPLEGCSGLAPFLPDAVVDKVASPAGPQSLISDDVEGFGLAEFFVEASASLSVEHSRLEETAFEHDVVVDVLAAPLVPFAADPEVADSTKLCDFLANLASKKLALMSPLCESLEEIPAACVVVPETVPAEDIQVDPGDPAADKLNAFLSSVFRPVPPPILTSPPLGDPVLLRRWPPRLVGVVASRSRSNCGRMLHLRSCLRVFWAS